MDQIVHRKINIQQRRTVQNMRFDRKKKMWDYSFNSNNLTFLLGNLHNSLLQKYQWKYELEIGYNEQTSWTLLFPCSRKRREQAGEVWCSFHSLTFLTFAVSKLCKTGCHPEKGFCTVSWENKSQRYFLDYCKNYIFKRFFRIIPNSVGQAATLTNFLPWKILLKCMIVPLSRFFRYFSGSY